MAANASCECIQYHLLSMTNMTNCFGAQAFEFEAGIVCLDAWVGKLESVLQQVTIRLPDGARSFAVVLSL